MAIVANRECPIVARAMQRFPGKYLPPTPNELASVGEAVCAVGAGNWALQGLSFAEDQTLSPYADLDLDARAGFCDGPNRLLFAAIKAPRAQRGLAARERPNAC